MSDHLPFEMQVKIMKSLPLKISLIRCRSVSKAWKSLIDSPDFISAHSVYHSHSHSHRLLVGYAMHYNGDTKYVSFLDSDTFIRDHVDLTVPLSVKCLKDSKVVGSCHGLVCLSGYKIHPGDFFYQNKYVAVLWNPSIRKAIAINLPDPNFFCFHETVFGFGVSSVARDPKILSRSTSMLDSLLLNESSISAHVNVFTLSLGAWQSTTIYLPFDLTEWSRSQAVVNGFIYWLVSNRISVEGKARSSCLIMSFDLNDDEFKEVYLPESLALKPFVNLFVSELRDSLAVIDNCWDNQCCDVWMMEEGALGLFTKLFTFKLPVAVIKGVLGFNKNGEPILELRKCCDRLPKLNSLGFYNPVAKQFRFSRIFGREGSFSACSYIDTLLLLNQKEVDHCFDSCKDETDGLSQCCDL